MLCVWSATQAPRPGRHCLAGEIVPRSRCRSCAATVSRGPTDAILVETHDTLVPDPQVQKEFSVTAMSIWRWDRDPELIKLGWPPPIRIRSRKFRSRIALENFKRVMARRAIEQRARP